MSSGIWALLGVLVGALISFGVKLTYEWVVRPQLEIKEDEPLQGQGAVYHSIRIANNGQTVAKNCNVLLTIKGNGNKDIVRSDIIDDSSRPAFVKSNSYRPVKDEPLSWAFQARDSTGKPINPAFLSISPKSSTLIDLCLVRQNNPLEIEVPSEMGWDIRRVILHGNKKYEVELKIFAENVRYDPKKNMRKFELIPDEGNKDIVIKPLKGDK